MALQLGAVGGHLGPRAHSVRCALSCSVSLACPRSDCILASPAMRSLQCTPGAAYCARCESGKYSDGNESTTCFRCGVREGYGQTQPELDEYNSVIDCDSGALLGLRNDTWAPYGIDENNFNHNNIVSKYHSRNNNIFSKSGCYN